MCETSWNPACRLRCSRSVLEKAVEPVTYSSKQVALVVALVDRMTFARVHLWTQNYERRADRAVQATRVRTLPPPADKRDQ